MLNMLTGSIFGLLLFVALASITGYIFILRKALSVLDPKAVVPERVRTAFNALAEGVLILDDKEITPSASIGTAIYPVHGDTADKLMSHADQAMYQVKRSSPE